jgi:hypothetical protein
MTRLAVAAALLVLLALDLGCVEGLSLEGPRCGQLTCDLHQYCSQLASRCESCASICDETSHNYEQSLCTKSCQGECFYISTECAISTAQNIFV